MFGFAVLFAVIAGAIAIAGRQQAGKTPVPKLPDLIPPPEEDGGPHESDIPWRSDAWVWEIYVRDGVVVDEVGDELNLDEGGLVPIEVAPGDTIVLRVEPGTRAELLAFGVPPVSWLELAVSAPEEGDYAWTVRAPKADAWRPTEIGVHDRRYGVHPRRFGFSVTLAE